MPVLKPAHDRILVKRHEPEQVSSGGIVLAPAAVDERTSKATVIAVGPGKYSEKTAVLIPMTVKAGDEILCHPAAGSKIVVGAETYWCLPESDVWCIVEPD
jgi:chaperonin GroES